MYALSRLVEGCIPCLSSCPHNGCPAWVAAANPTDEHRPALQSRSGQLLDGGEKRIHIDV